MYIKPSDLPTAAPFPSVRPQAAALGPQLSTQTQPGPVNLALSGAVRALSAALAPLLPDLGSVHLSDILTQQDRVLLTRAWEFAEARGEDRAQVPRLALDLSVFRAEAEPFAELRPILLAAAARASTAEVGTATPDSGVPRGPGTSAVVAARAAFQPQDAQAPRVLSEAEPSALRLPAFTARDEQLARAILTRLSPRDSALPRDFVRALLDPDRQPVHAVDLGFVRKLIEALHAPSAALEVVSAPMTARDARETLARSIEALGLALTELPLATPHAASRALQLLRESVVRWMAAAHGEVRPDSPVQDKLASTGSEDAPAHSLALPAERARSGSPPAAAKAGEKGPPKLEAPRTAPPALAPAREHAQRSLASQTSAGREPSLPALPAPLEPAAPLAPSLPHAAPGEAPPAPSASLPTLLVPPQAGPMRASAPPSATPVLPDLPDAATPPAAAPSAPLPAHAGLPRAELAPVEPPHAEPLLPAPQRARVQRSPAYAEPSSFTKGLPGSALIAQHAGAVPVFTKDTSDVMTGRLQTSEDSRHFNSPPQQTSEQTEAGGTPRASQTTSPLPRGLESPEAMDGGRPAREPPMVHKPDRAPLEALSANDRTLLGVLYLAVARRGSDPRAVDQVALALLTLREAERAHERGAVEPSSRPPTRATDAPAREPAPEESALGVETQRAPNPQEPVRPPAHEAQRTLATPLREHAPPSEAPARPERENGPSHGPPLPARPADARPHLPTAGYGSNSQLLAKLSDAYRSLAPADRYGPALQSARPEVALSVSPQRSPGLDAGQEHGVGLGLARPVDVAQSLGVSGLIVQMRREAQRARRARLRVRGGRAVQGVESLRRAACEEEADEPMPDTPARRRRVRWHLLQQRRKRSRAQDT